MTLRDTLFKSGIWLQVSKFAQMASNILVTVVLARLLEPDIFGLVGIVLIYSGFLSQFVTFGITLAIVQKKEVTQSQLSTVFWLNLGFNVLAGFIIVISSPLASKFYNQPKLTSLIYLLSINFLILPLFQIHRRLLEKNLLFKKIAIVEFVSISGSGIIAIVLAICGFGVYSLIWQPVSMTFINMIGFWSAYKWKPNFTFNFGEVKELFYFSIKMKLARLGNYFERNIDYLILSKLFSTTLYGYYTLAYRVLYFPVRRLTYVFGEVLFPAFSFIQEKPEKIKKGILKSMYLLSFVLFPITIILVFFSDPIVNIFLGTKWIYISKVLYLFSLAGTFQSLEGVANSLYPALNKPGILIKLEIIRTIFTGIAVYLGSFYEIFGVAVALVLSRGLLFLLSLYYVNKLIQISLRDYFITLKSCLVATSITVIFYYFLRMNFENKWLYLIINLSTGIILYITTFCFSNFKEFRYMISLVYNKK